MTGTGRGHVGHAQNLGVAAGFFAGLEKLELAVVVAAAPALGLGSRYGHQARARLCLPGHRRRLVAAGPCAQAGQHHGVPLQALGLVHGHELNGDVGVGIGRCHQVCHAAFQLVKINVATLLHGGQQIQKTSRVEHSRVVGPGGSAQLKPRSLDNAGHRHTPQQATRTVNNRQYAARALTAVLAHATKRCIVSEQLGHRLVMR